MRIFYIYDRFKHHSSYSGYDIFTRYISLPKVYYKKNFSFRFLKKIANKKVLNRISEIDIDWYKEDCFLSEIDILPRVSLCRDTIFHFLYGENSYRFFGYNPIKWNNKVIVSFHQPPGLVGQAIREEKYFRGIDAVLIVGENQRKMFERLVGKNRVFYVPHGVDTDFFKPHPEKVFDKDSFECVSVGWWQRDIEMLIGIIQMINRQTRFKIKFNIITFDWLFKYFQGPDNVELSCGISDEHLLMTYQNADILLLPLKDCTTNNAVLEAISCGLPVVSTRVGSLTDYIDDSCAILLKRGDIVGAVDSIYSLFLDVKRRMLMASCARKKAEEFDYRRIALLHAEVYHKVYAM